MIVPVYWVSRHAGIKGRGYADQGLLEQVLARQVWTPPDPITFVHHEFTFTDVDLPTDQGAVVVLPSRHHCDEIGWFVEWLDQLPWSVVLLTSEEEWEFQWWRIEQTDTRRLWVWQPRPEHAGAVSWMMPCGPYTWEGVSTHEHLSAPAALTKPLDWFFGGQVTHTRRVDCVHALKTIDQGRFPGDILATERYFDGIPFGEYLNREAQAKIVPCPSGPVSLCTARVEEALEAGSLPIVDLVKPVDPQFDYWRTVFGDDCPLRGIYNWAEFPAVLVAELAAWPRNVNLVQAWWQQWKRRTALRLDDDIRAVAGQPRTYETPDDQVTVIMPTSPTPVHPSTEHIEQTIDSVRAQLPYAQIIVVADGVRPEQYDRRGDYQEYLRRLLWLCNYRWHNVVPLVLDDWGHQANATRAALELVETPLVMFVEHDTPVVGEIDWSGICAFIRTGEANAIRFHQDTEMNPEHDQAIMLDHATQWLGGSGHAQGDDWIIDERKIPLRRTIAWWQRPHIASTRFYRDRIMPLFSTESRTMIEDLLYGVVHTHCVVHGEAGWWDWRVWVYTPDGNMQRSRHLDSRAGAEKFDMKFH